MTPQDQLHASASAAARQRGNDLYKNKAFEKAMEAYREAASLTPSDPAPLSNLSAVSFETGRYSDAVKFITQALELSWSASDHEQKKQKLYARLIKSLLYTNDSGEASKVLSYLKDTHSAEGLSKAALQTNIAETMDFQASATQPSRLRSQILDRLPRYRPYMHDVPEYYAVGHDHAESVFQPTEVKAMVTRQDDISMMFCGCGDARHVFMTIFALAPNLALLQTTERFKRIHFTLVDIKPASLAKFVLIHKILFQCTAEDSWDSARRTDALVASIYLYTCQIVPPYVLELLYGYLDHLVEALDSDQGDVVPGLCISPDTRRAISRVMKQWRQPLGSHYSVSRLRPHIREAAKLWPSMSEEAFGPEIVVSKKDRKDFDSFGCLFADQAFFQRHEPRLVALYSAYESSGSRKRKRLEEYIDANWKVNVTLLDSDHEATMSGDLAKIASYHASGCEPWSVHDDDPTARLAESDPSKALGDLTPGSLRKPVLTSIGPFFLAFATAIRLLEGKLIIELAHGEMTDFMDRLRFDTLDYRSSVPGSDGYLDPRTFPKTYDLVHLSSIPDYIGGHLTTFLSARPLLRKHKQASLMFNNLLNPPLFDSHEQFQAEYLLMPGKKQIADHFHLVREADEFQDMFGPSMAPPGLSSSAMEGYFVWKPAPIQALPFPRLMSREQLETWIYGHLFKVCLPCPRPVYSDRPVITSLNLTIVFLLLEHLFEVGYPAHWLSGIVASICEGRITTRARPPRTIVMELKDLAEEHPKIEMSIGAWRAEFTTLFTIWRRVLPFGVIAPQGATTSLQRIREHSVAFPLFEVEGTRVPHFMLVFWDTNGANGREPPRRISEMLSFDHVGSTRGVETTTVKAGIHIVTAFRFTTSTRTASFWMRDDVVEDMKAGSWKVYIWRTDNWNRLTEGVDVTRDLKGGQAWSES